MYIEKKIMEMDNSLIMNHENIKRLCQQMNVLEQVHHAPSIYIASITEIARRQSFTKDYMNVSCRHISLIFFIVFVIILFLIGKLVNIFQEKMLRLLNSNEKI